MQRPKTREIPTRASVVDYCDRHANEIWQRKGKMMLTTRMGLMALLAIAVSTGSTDAAMILGEQGGNDAAAVNALLGLAGDDAFVQSEHTTNIDGDHDDEFGPLLAYFTVHDANPADPDLDGIAFDSDDQIIQFALQGVPIDQVLVEPFFISIKVGGRDNFIYQWDTSKGDTFEDPGTGGVGFVDYHSMVFDLTKDPLDGSTIQQGISHVAIVARIVPEPSFFAMTWLSLIGALGLMRRRNKAG